MWTKRAEYSPQMSNSRLEELTDEELRLEARRRGLPVGGSLSREQLLALLTSSADQPEATEGFDDEEDADSTSDFPTVTMARLYAEQGHRGEAARLCRVILAREPDEGRARELLARLAETRPEPRRVSTAQRSPTLTSSFDEGSARLSKEVPSSYGEPMVLLTAVNPSELHVAWEAPSQTVDQARRHAGKGAALVLRLFSAWRGDEGVERRTADSAAKSAMGSAFVRPCAPGALHRAALGFSVEDRFIPIIHSGSAATPAGEPSRSRRRLVASVRSADAGASAAATSAAAGRAMRIASKLAEGLPMDLPWEGAEAEWPAPEASAELPDAPEELPPRPTSPSFD